MSEEIVSHGENTEELKINPVKFIEEIKEMTPEHIAMLKNRLDKMTWDSKSKWPSIRLTLFQQVRAFHEKFEQPRTDGPRELPEDLQQFRINFMHEELREYELAVQEGNLEKALDSLVDLVWVALGAADVHGFPFDEGWDRVFEANMKKVKVANEGDDHRSVRKSRFDIVKPEGWVAPDLSDLVRVAATETETSDA